MTAREQLLAEPVAKQLEARRTGVGRWMAKCPAHDDSSPSLSIASGRGGRLLLRCWAGCSLDAILRASGLTIQNLFPQGPPPSLGQAVALAREREAKAEQKRLERQVDRQARDKVWKLETIVNALGGKLARDEENDELARLFHLACDKHRAAYTATYKNERPVVSGPVTERIA
jgi:hypothetical protein